MNAKLLELASFILDFGKVNRKTCHQDGEYPESDTDHTVALGIIGASLAKKMYPDLDIGRVTQFALVHDLVEVYAGDTPTLVLRGSGEEFFREKEGRETEAFERIKNEFGGEFSWIPETIEQYERLDTKEARFIKVLDKVLPKFTVLLNKAKAVNKSKYVTKTEVEKTFALQREKLNKIAPDMPELLELWEYFVAEELKLIKD